MTNPNHVNKRTPPGLIFCWNKQKSSLLLILTDYSEFERFPKIQVIPQTFWRAFSWHFEDSDKISEILSKQVTRDSWTDSPHKFPHLFLDQNFVFQVGRKINYHPPLADISSRDISSQPFGHMDISSLGHLVTRIFRHRTFRHRTFRHRTFRHR